MTTAEIDALNAALAHYSSSQTLHPHWTRRVRYTDGVKLLADRAGAYWFLDVVVSHQLKRKVAVQPFQVWTLRLGKSGGCTVTADDGNGNVLVRQKVEFTDFPLPDGIKLYLDGGVLMLPQER